MKFILDIIFMLKNKIKIHESNAINNTGLLILFFQYYFIIL